MSLFKDTKRDTKELNRDAITVSRAATQKERGAGLWLKAKWDGVWYMVLDIEKPNREGWHQSKLLSGYDEFLINLEGIERLYTRPNIEELHREIVASLCNIRSSHTNGIMIFNRFEDVAKANNYTRALWLAGYIQQNETF